MWELFYRTGNVETYLLLKRLENEQLEDILNIQLNNENEITSMHTNI